LGKLKTVAVVGLALGLIGLVTWLFLPRGAPQPTVGTTGNDGNATSLPARVAAVREDADEKKLEGDWKLVGGWVVEGERFPLGPGEVIWSFHGDKVIHWMTGRPDDHLTFKLASDKKPKEIDLTNTDEQGRPRGLPPLQWVYELDGDTLRFCKPLPGTTGRPKEVASKPGSETMHFELKRQPAARDRGGEGK
jgi:uncharacterized protein (TIGR03067 family)